MPVTFITKSHPRIIQLDSVAGSLLTMMGHGGDIPGALKSAEVAQAAKRLRDALAKLHDSETAQEPLNHEDEEESSVQVPLSRRAQPLLELLDSAAAHQHHVMWE